ncbi:flagellar hook-associated protein FlgK [Oceanibium sediminis]|uniref:flagellar hook-associated protein FlgK n=1 Tax=Oceanibium sediminis TaxID=2026339 RepID=UPI000DD2C839|nr:flagellar hook-associated protein FlgK [Oceanibium sediminis]
MSLSTALSNALSGLNTSSLEAELISNNVANAQTPGYTRRVAELTALSTGGSGAGVAVSGVQLMQDPAAVANRRRSDAELGAQNVALDGLSRIAGSLGVPGEGTALADLAASFETSLLAAANDPGSTTRLSNAVTSAVRYGDALTSLSTETQRVRMDADAEIATQVAQVNENLASIDVLNREIQMLSISGGDASALIDARKALIDQVSSVLPIRSSARPNGEVALYTAGGAQLLDGRAATLGFTAKPVITQDMTLGSGALSGLTLNGKPLSVGAPDGSGQADGGSLGALFVQRDTTMPEFANQLDALAADLVNRFQDPAIDGTRAVGDPGLFTDNGGAFSAVDIEGLAGRLSVNAAVDPAEGGAVWRLRDGLGAATTGDSGDGRLLDTLSTAAWQRLAPDPSLGFTGSGGVADFAASLTSVVAGREQQAEGRVAYTSALNTALRSEEIAVSGVNTDNELQKLLMVEKSYAANAFVLSTVDNLIQRLLEI